MNQGLSESNRHRQPVHRQKLHLPHVSIFFHPSFCSTILCSSCFFCRFTVPKVPLQNVRPAQEISNTIHGAKYDRNDSGPANHEFDGNPMVIHTLIQLHCQVFTHILLHVFSHFHSFTIFLHILYSIKDRTPPALGHTSSPHAGNIDELSNILEDITNMLDPDNDNRTDNAHVTPRNAGIEEVLPHCSLPCSVDFKLLHTNHFIIC
jgi:hypothetical protein